MYCIRCSKYRKFKNTKVSFVFDKPLVVSIICNTYESKDEKTFKEKESINILNILHLIKNVRKIYMKKEII